MTDRAAVIEKIAAAMRESGLADDLADLSGRAEIEARYAAEKKRNGELSEALENVADSYRALSAVADLMLLGGVIPGQPRKTLDCIDADDMFALLRILALSLAKPLGDNRFI